MGPGKNWTEGDREPHHGLRVHQATSTMGQMLWFRWVLQGKALFDEFFGLWCGTVGSSTSPHTDNEGITEGCGFAMG